MNERFAVVDVETTGLSAARDRVVEMACVQIDRGFIVDRRSTVVDPQIAIPAFLSPLAVAHRALGDARVTAHVLLACRERCSSRKWRDVLALSAIRTSYELRSA